MAIIATRLFAHHGVNAWWFFPLAALGLLALSLSRAAGDAEDFLTVRGCPRERHPVRATSSAHAAGA